VFQCVAHRDAADGDDAADTANGLPWHADDALQERDIGRQITALCEEVLQRFGCFDGNEIV
jgi:hypothetical protein